ncbi:MULTISPECIES: thiamine-phosphate kinase [unclassified Leucobacter]|uniref:thiamine-phosphate kinase n=1 Tax=unclassified Leucobacter TaxID=2621730 RepID=UPI00165EB273|nr:MULTISPECIES: thiamine-phosphate kinase [unclassified Leucobacter]MBC9926395.1 thiamine-phosphate kinase [Leucobacter sp. cx-169]
MNEAHAAGLTIGELGEAGVLTRVLARLGEAAAATVGPGDDAAVLTSAGDLVVTSDAMIEGPDFRLSWSSGYELGWKLAATNLSDVAAMGAMPIGLTVIIAAPASTPVALLEAIASGLDDACRDLAPGCGVVGGDLSNAPVLSCAVTALGDLGGRRPVLRSGARVGDVVAYAGDLGLAGRGLSLLFERCGDEQEDDGQPVEERLTLLRAAHPIVLAAQLAPAPPIAAGVRAADGGATAMMDVSDSLSLDSARLGKASGVTLDLDPALLAAGFGWQRGEAVSVEDMLTGGEDHGMLATFPAGAPLPEGFAPIGRAVARGATLLLGGEATEPRGWDPYRSGR